MCFDLDSRPPIPPIFGGATDARDLKLTSADGTKFMAYAARATSPTGAGMVVIPDVRGIHQYYKELALRFAELRLDERKSEAAVDLCLAPAGDPLAAGAREEPPLVEDETAPGRSRT